MTHENQASDYWMPTASINVLAARATMMNNIRQFFAKRKVMEVDTPAMATVGASDPHLHSFSTTLVGFGVHKGQKIHLQTSPEYAMKRLLCAGSGDIYQICKAYRNEELGKIHSPEFTMLEWYRVGFDHHMLMDELSEFMVDIVGCQHAERLSYQQVFIKYLELDPLEADFSRVQSKACELGYQHIANAETNKDSLLNLLFSLYVEPNIGLIRPCLVYNFPASQAALAKISPQDSRVAERFELYFKGLELANGFNELQDANEQRQRFIRDNQMRAQMGLDEMEHDEALLSALDYGLPACAGLALGIDRLCMLMLNKARVSEVMAFSVLG